MRPRIFTAAVVLFGLLASGLSTAAPDESALPVVEKVEIQPFREHLRLLREALELLGAPLSMSQRERIDAAVEKGEVEAVQGVLDPLCLAGVDISPESRVKVAPGPARPELLQGGWRMFLVKVHNQAGVTAKLRVNSPQAKSVPGAAEEQVAERWMEMELFGDRPFTPKLSGLELEYRIVQIYSRDEGKRSASIAFDVGQGTQDIGFRNDVSILFNCHKATAVTLRILDEDGQPATAALVVRDRLGRIYPATAKRLAPDFFFHPQVYREDGEKLGLPPGRYTATISRGPEYLEQKREIVVGQMPQTEQIRLERWVDPSKLGWWSGDHHIHAAGCAHYTRPSEGVLPTDMARHIRGEDLKVGCNLTWGPCFDYQKQFFTGKIDASSAYPYLLRYDIEVSGFGSHQSGHLCLLRLRDQMYPGGNSSAHWPTLGLNTLRWAKKQGAVCGPAHSGWGLEVKTKDLPNYEIPPFDGIGANEYIVDVTHTVEGPQGRPVPAIDFMSTVDTPYVWELNMWYHTLNCGFRTRASGETDFPCIYGERVGLGRSYVKLDGRLDFDAWCEGIRQGRSYVGDGRSHLMDFQVGDMSVGENGSELRMEKAGRVHVAAKVAAFLPETPNPDLRDRPYDKAPYWHIERARVGDSRRVKLEVIVNGRPVAQREIDADGQTREQAFDVQLERSSWVAMRILPSSHTNPVFVVIGDKPIRASRRSVQWCIDGVEQCWKEKQRTYARAEQSDARAAYDHAREVYRRLLGECEVD